MSKEKEVKPKPEELWRTWNTFVHSLLKARENWRTHRALVAKFSSDEIGALPSELSRFVSKSFNRSKFDILIAGLVHYWRTIGGLEELIAKKKKE